MFFIGISCLISPRTSGENTFYGQWKNEMEMMDVSANVSYGGNIASGDSLDASAITIRDGGYWIHNSGTAQGYVETYNFKNPINRGPNIREIVWDNMTFEPYTNFDNCTIDYVSLVLITKSDHGLPGGHFTFTTNSPASGNTQAYPFAYGNWTNLGYEPPMFAVGGYPAYLPLLRTANITSLRDWTMGDLMSNSSFRVAYVWEPVIPETDFYFDYIGIWYDYHYKNDTLLSTGGDSTQDYEMMNQANGFIWIFVIFLPSVIAGGALAGFQPNAAKISFMVVILFMLFIVWTLNDSFIVFMLMGIIGCAVTFYKGISLMNMGLFSVSILILVLIWVALLPAYLILIALMIYAGMFFMESGSAGADLE
jgi:hypothetical protein